VHGAGVHQTERHVVGNGQGRQQVEGLEDINFLRLKGYRIGFRWSEDYL
jgi:hypothetical protein